MRLLSLALAASTLIFYLRNVADAIYSRVPGASFVNVPAASGMVWTLPCDVELNVTFKFGGVSYPVNPLDTNLGSMNIKGPDGNEICVGSFQPITTASSSRFDMILGMAFRALPLHLILRATC